MDPRATNCSSNASSHHSGARKKAMILLATSSRLPPRSWPNIFRSPSSLSIVLLHLPLVRPQFREHDNSISLDEGSCTSTLRIIRSTQKPATMPPLNYHLRGHRPGINPLFLRTRARCSGVGIPHALLAVAERLRCPSPADRTIQATPTQAIQATQSVCRTDPEAALRPV